MRTQTQVPILFFEVEPIEVPVHWHRGLCVGVRRSRLRDIGPALVERTAVQPNILLPGIEFRKDD